MLSAAKDQQLPLVFAFLVLLQSQLEGKKQAKARLIVSLLRPVCGAGELSVSASNISNI